ALDEREHVAGRGERAEEVGRGAGVRRLRDEAEKAVEAEHEEHEPERDARRVRREVAKRSHEEPPGRGLEAQRWALPSRGEGPTTQTTVPCMQRRTEWPWCPRFWRSCGAAASPALP